MTQKPESTQDQFFHRPSLPNALADQALTWNEWRHVPGRTASHGQIDFCAPG